MCSYLGFFRLERGMGKGLNFGSSAKEGLVSSKQDVKEETIDHILLPYAKARVLWQLLFALFQMS